MAGAVCHEINQPLQVVQGQTELLKIESEKYQSLQKNLSIICNSDSKYGKNYPKTHEYYKIRDQTIPFKDNY